MKNLDNFKVALGGLKLTTIGSELDALKSVESFLYNTFVESVNNFYETVTENLKSERLLDYSLLSHNFHLAQGFSCFYLYPYGTLYKVRILKRVEVKLTYSGICLSYEEFEKETADKLKLIYKNSNSCPSKLLGLSTEEFIKEMDRIQKYLSKNEL